MKVPTGYSKIQLSPAPAFTVRNPHTRRSQFGKAPNRPKGSFRVAENDRIFGGSPQVVLRRGFSSRREAGEIPPGSIAKRPAYDVTSFTRTQASQETGVYSADLQEFGRNSQNSLESDSNLERVEWSVMGLTVVTTTLKSTRNKSDEVK
ncbi:unnamed protein product [Calicophoron daubneyi]|uniref:Uncharacterized protein n=1 Tax=Calicophoron daubneyi TaxID=300641 RepID=A0AAV2TE13_CALDB